MNPRRFVLAALALVGTVLLTVALTAHWTGLDPENNWGAARRQVLGAGLSGLGAVAALWLWQAFLKTTGTALAKLQAFTRGATQTSWGMPLSKGMLGLGTRAHRVFTAITNGLRILVGESTVGQWVGARAERPARLAAGLVFCLAVPVAIWFVSVGYWDEWPNTGHYYDDLAEGFSAGQLHLLETPDPALLALPDPYEFEQRRHIPTPWDVVLFDGKFYLYWGPVPGVLLAAWKAVMLGVVRDNVLVFLSVLGTVLFTLLTLVELWNTRNRELPIRALLPALLVGAFAHPLPWLLNRPAVYEASIAAGQCFLMAGLFLASPALLRGRAPGWRLALAGACWACAIGSRATLGPAVIFWACLTAGVSWLGGRRAVGRYGSLLASLVILPMLAGLLATGWYNAERFGSPLELGHRYQLTGMNLHRNYSQVFSPNNVLVNAYNYLLRPFRTLSVFPYIKPEWGTTAIPVVTSLSLRFPVVPNLNPPLYYAEQVTGLVYTLPFAVFVVIACMLALKRADDPVGGGALANDGGSAARRPARAVILALVFGSALAFAPSLLFIVATARYLADVVPSLVLLSSIGAWEWVNLRKARGGSIVGRLSFLWLAALASVVISLLLAVTGYDMRFELLNPELFDRIVRFFAL